jgi:hypothetical protein
MTISNFAYFLDGVTIRGVPIQQLFPGKVFFVNNSSVLPDGGKAGSNTNKGSYLRPFSTIDYAIGRCTAGRGDIICVMPGHAETISAAAGIAIDVAGVAIVGLGVGTSRPTITLDTATTASITVSAANCAVKNLIISANFADIVTVFDVAAATDFCIESCYFKATATNMNFLNIVDTSTVDNAADGLCLLNNTWIEPDLATLSLVKQDNTLDRVRIEGNYVNLGVNNNKAALVTIANGKIVTNLRMVKNSVYRLNTDTATGAILLHTNGSTLTGIVAENFAQHADTAAELLITASSGLGCFANYASGVAGASGYLLPAADA